MVWGWRVGFWGGGRGHRGDGGNGADGVVAGDAGDGESETVTVAPTAAMATKKGICQALCN